MPEVFSSRNFNRSRDGANERGRKIFIKMYYTTLTWGKKEEYKYSEETEGKIRHNSKHSRSLIIETSWYRHCIFFIFSYWNALSSGLFRAHIHPCTHSLTPHQRQTNRDTCMVHCVYMEGTVYTAAHWTPVSLSLLLQHTTTLTECIYVVLFRGHAKLLSLFVISFSSVYETHAH